MAIAGALVFAAMMAFIFFATTDLVCLAFPLFLLFPAINYIYARSKKSILLREYQYALANPPLCSDCDSKPSVVDPSEQRKIALDRIDKELGQALSEAEKMADDAVDGVKNVGFAFIGLAILGLCALSGLAAILMWDSNQSLAAVLALPPIALVVWMLMPEKRTKTAEPLSDMQKVAAHYHYQRWIQKQSWYRGPKRRI